MKKHVNKKSNFIRYTDKTLKPLKSFEKGILCYIKNYICNIYAPLIAQFTGHALLCLYFIVHIQPKTIYKMH